MRPGHGFAAWHLPVAITILCAATAAAYLIAGQAPSGVIQGQVLAEDTGAPLPNAHVHLEPLFPMRDRISGTLALRSREDGAFGPHRLIAGRYRLSAYTKAHTLADTLITIPEAETRSLSLELARDPSRLQVYVHEHVWTPDEPVTALCEGLLEDDELSVSVYAADLVRLLRTAGGSLYRWVARADERFPEGIAASPDFTLIASISVPITGRDIEGSFQQHVRIPLPKPGLYVLAIRGDGIERKNWVLVTDLGLITKQYGDTVLAYAADLASGSPVARASVTVYRGDAVVARGATGPDGIARLRLPSSRHSASMLIFARRRQSLAAVQTWYSPASAREFVVYTYTDRPVYRPGHLVHFKGIARRVRGDSYEVPDGEALLVEVRDDRDTLLYREQLRTNDYGAFSGALKLPPTAGPGRYELQATIRGKRHISGFFVAEYRKPQYRVAVRSNRPRYVRGDTALVTVAAEYYFGEPVAGAAVGYSVRRTSYWFPVDPETAWEYYDYEGEGYGGYGEIVESGHTETGDDGKATIRISTGRSDDEESDHDWRYAVEVNVTGPGRQTVTSSGGFIVTRGEFVLHLTARRWGSRPGQSIPIDLRAVDYDRKPQPNVPVAVTLQRRTWRDDEVHFTQEERQQVRTDADGKAAFTVTPRQEGSYVLKAVARDARGNTIVGREYLWVTSSRYADFAYDYPDLEIITDKPVYEVGDQIAALINTKAHGATALVTVEGEGLRDWFLTKLEGKSTRLTLPVRPEYIPNVYLTVSLVRNKDFVWRQKPLRVSQRSRTLTLSLEPNKPEYAPGEPATYDITTLDPQGRPVPAEISLGVVDDSIYAVREESVPDIVDAFYARRPNLVSTDYSFPRIYLGNADKAGGRPRVRKRFPDTAFWRPVIRTNAEGKARVSFKMPDTLTTWRATARAITLDTLAGSAVNKVVCRKDFMVRLNTPRFLVQGDRATITGIAHNRTPRPLQVRASLDAGGLEVLRAPALAFTIPPAGTHRFEWTIRPFAVGRPRLTLSAHAPSRLRDALAKSLPVIPRGRERVEWRAGAVASATRERLVVRRDAVPGTPRGLLLLSPSITSSIWDALEYLAQYPWGCTEQTMSSFLPDVLIAQALDDLGISRPRLAESLPDMVQAGLIKLYGYQRDDGGWGWCRYGGSDPWMTAYVLFGLVVARDAGFYVNRRVLRAALDRLAKQVARDGLPEPDRAFAAYVLAVAGRKKTAGLALARLEKRAGRLSAADLALATLARLELGDRARARRLYTRLSAKDRESRSLCHWPGASSARGAWPSDIEATALALKAMLRLQPHDGRVLKTIRWLMARRRGRRWISTRDTAWVICAVADFARVSRELQPDFAVSVSLNGEPLRQDIRFAPDSLFSPQVRVDIPPEDLRPGDNVLELDKTGPGNLYYSLRLSQYVGGRHLFETITGAGLRVERNYYRLSLRRDKRTGRLELRPDRKPQTRFKVGDLVRVKLSVACPTEMAYMIVQDPRPAGAEVLSRGDLYPWEWDRWYSDVDVRDRLVAFFARRIPAGRREIAYDLRMEVPGRFHALPTEAYCMYDPDARGSGPPAVIEVED